MCFWKLIYSSCCILISDEECQTWIKMKVIITLALCLKGGNLYRWCHNGQAAKLQSVQFQVGSDLNVPRFSKVGSLELVFWLETGVCWTNKFLPKFVSQELKFSQNPQKLGLKMQFKTKNRSEVSGAGKELEMVDLQG